MDKERILVVEDEPRVAQALCRVLTLPEGGGYRVESCDSAEAALERFPRERFDLLVTDLSMPGLSGLELLQRVHELSPQTRTILITAFGSEAVEQRAQGLADAYIPKPFSMKAFVKSVREILSRKSPSAPPLAGLSTNAVLAIQSRIDLLRSNLGALGVLVIDQEGHVLAECGQRPDLDATNVLSILGSTMFGAKQLAQVLDEDDAFNLNLHQGKRYDIYSGLVNSQFFICLVLDRATESTSPLSMVWLSLRRAITDLRGLMAKPNVKSNRQGLESGATSEANAEHRPAPPSSAISTPGPGAPARAESQIGTQVLPDDRPEKGSRPSPPPVPKPWPAALLSTESKPRAEAAPSNKSVPPSTTATSLQAELKPEAARGGLSTPQDQKSDSPIEPQADPVMSDPPKNTNGQVQAKPTSSPELSSQGALSEADPPAPMSSSRETAQPGTQSPTRSASPAQAAQPFETATLGEADMQIPPDSIPETTRLLSFDEALALGILKPENLPDYVLHPKGSRSKR